MKFLAYLFFLLLAFNLNNPAFSSDLSKGKELSASCAACHGDEGISLNPTWPKIAGQNPKYLASQLYDKLTGKGSVIDYNFDNFTVLVPSKVGSDAIHTKWVIDGSLKISTKNTKP